MVDEEGAVGEGDEGDNELSGVVSSVGRLEEEGDQTLFLVGLAAVAVAVILLYGVYSQSFGGGVSTTAAGAR